MLGFADQAHLARWLKRVYGLTPRKATLLKSGNQNVDTPPMWLQISDFRKSPASMGPFTGDNEPPTWVLSRRVSSLAPPRPRSRWRPPTSMSRGSSAEDSGSSRFCLHWLPKVRAVAALRSVRRAKIFSCRFAKSEARAEQKGQARAEEQTQQVRAARAAAEVADERGERAQDKQRNGAPAGPLLAHLQASDEAHRCRDPDDEHGCRARLAGELVPVLHPRRRARTCR